ncbi:MAG: phosphoribosyltransferase family protein [Pseudomonadota bacterium]|nr:phosphoribosyltransferase family protein [Pseudomonadota bacterium]
MWQDREQAARALVGALRAWQGTRPVVLAIPRGAVPMGAVVADALGGELDVVLVHKIGHPMQPELAIGAVDERGHVLPSETATMLGVPHATLEALGRAEVARLKQRRQLYGGAPANIKGRTVILVDDGIATGATMLAAVGAARSDGAKEVVVAAPVASQEAATRLRRVADAVVILETPRQFMAVGQFYVDFRQVEDQEVRALLASRRTVPVA